MKIISTIFLLLISNLALSQTANVFIEEPTLNGEYFENGVVYKGNIERVFANLKNAPTLVERANLTEILEVIQNEINLAKDFNVKTVDTLNPHKVDYAIFSNFISSPLKSYTILRIECVKISGESALSKFVYPAIKLDR